MRVIVYKTTCLVNDKYYIGVHREDFADDGYIGCGISSESQAKNRVKGKSTHFQRAVFKYGYKNFTREVLKVFENEAEAYAYEKSAVNHKDPMSYNQIPGGRWNTFNHGSEYVVVDTKETKKYFCKNLRSWCRRNNKHAVNFRQGLQNVINGKCRLYKNRWWACYKDYWTGEVVEKEDKPKSIYKYNESISLLRWDGEIFEFENSRQAYNFVGGDESSFYKCIKMNGRVHLGFKRLFKATEKKPFKYKKPTKVGQICLVKDGIKIYKYSDVKEAEADTGIDRSSIYKMISGKLKSYKQYKIYKDGDILSPAKKKEAGKYSEIILEKGGEIFSFTSTKDACNFTGSHKASLCALIKGKLKTTYGYSLKSFTEKSNHPIQIFQIT